jgi:hypothetical protein
MDALGVRVVEPPCLTPQLVPNENHRGCRTSIPPLDYPILHWRKQSDQVSLDSFLDAMVDECVRHELPATVCAQGAQLPPCFSLSTCLERHEKLAMA